MKTKVLTLALALLFSFNSLMYSQNTSVPDNNFENFLETRTATGAVVPIGDPTSLGDGVMNDLVPTSKISGLTEINLFNQLIADLTGIEDFASLTKLDARGNSLTSLDVSMLALTYLDIYNSNVTSIDLSSNTALTYLDLGNNSLMSIDVTSNTNLLNLLVGGNNLTELNVSQNTNLIELACGNIGLTTIDLSANNSLERFVCPNSGIMSLDFTNNTNLIELFINNNESLSSISLPNHPNLTQLQCYMGVGKSSSLSSIDVSMCPNLETFWCYNNNIAGTLDLSNNTKLVNFDCGENNITEINMPNDEDTLIRIVCDNNSLTTLDLSNNEAFTLLQCFNNTSMTSIVMPTTNTSSDIDIYNTGLVSLDISGLTGLKTLDFFNNNSLTSISLPTSNALVELDGSNTGLLSLDASMVSGLEYFRINNSSSLTSLTLPNTSTLQTFWMYGHNLPSIDFTPYTNLYTGLQYLDVGNSNLTSVDVSMLEGLIEFYFYDNNLLESLNIANGNNATLEWMWAYNNPLLSCIQVDNKVLADNKDPYNWQPGSATYEENCATASTEDFALSGALIYPNPAKDNFYIDLQLEAYYTLNNVFGQEVKKGFLIPGNNELETNTLSTGLYLLKIESPEGSVTKKLIKE